MGDHATNMPSAMRFGNRVVTPSAAEGSKTQFVRLDNLKYAYDSCGNISEIRENGELAVRYSYDKLNRLVCEDNRQLNIITWFTYDNNGNILSKRVKSADSDEKTLYGYDGDRLLCFGNETFVYDTLGNPTTYRGKEAQWERGRQLKSFNGVEFTYDGQGRRIRKGTTYYTYDSNGNLIKQVDGADTLEFFYDHSGVIGFEHTANNDTKTYIYRRNAQGDIIALLDKNGNVVVKYVYDAWGNHEIRDSQGNKLDYKENDEENNKLYTIADLNPFRYRGYYYDTETKLYYLKSRYYDPEVGRFITIDDLSYLDPEHINGLNLYAYCGNNPIMHIDPDGTSIQDLLTFFERVFSGFSDIYKSFANTVTTKSHVTKRGGWGLRYYNRQANQAAAEATQMSKVLGKVATVLAVATLAIDIGISWYNNYKSGNPYWISESIVDTLYIGARFAIGFGITALCSLIPIPILGTLIGIGLSIAVDYAITWIMEKATNVLETIKGWAATVETKIKDGWYKFTNWIAGWFD